MHGLSKGDFIVKI